MTMPGPMDPPATGAALPQSSGWALAALGGVIVVTVGWWTLALWPLPAEAPEWMARARAACFGQTISGLPNGGGWALLIGQPLGMLVFLFAVWGGSVTRSLEALRQRWVGRLALAATALLLLVGSAAAASRVASAKGTTFDPNAGLPATGPLVEMNEAAPALNLLDQSGARLSIEQFRGAPLLVTFAFAHCETVCPLLVRDAIAARARLAPPRPPLVIVTLDPWRDVPSRLPAIAAAWQLPEGVHVVSGEVAEVEEVLSRWKIPRVRNPSTGDVIHPSVVYVVAPNGRIAYMADGTPDRVVQGVEQVRR